MTNAATDPKFTQEQEIQMALYSDKSALERYTSDIYTKRAVMRDELQRKESEVESLKASIAEQDLALEELNHYYLAHAKNYNPFEMSAACWAEVFQEDW
jgi:hypothetical protein